MHLIFWQNCQSILQIAHIEALVRAGVRVTWVVETEISPERKKLGWSVPHIEGVELVVAPNESKLRALALQKDAHHIFSGIRGYAMVNRAFKLCVRNNQLAYILVENRNDQGIKGKMRALLYKLDGFRYRKQVGAILCMGYGGAHGGRKWYRSCGFREDQIFPYCYFMPLPPPPTQVHGSPVPRLLFAGQYVHRKGGDLLLQALAQLQSFSWQLEFAGTGPEQAAWEAMAASLGLGKRVVFNPALPNAELMEKLSESDLLILPSRFDGWGAVVNEALMRGVPTICSDRCGAQDLIGAPWRGAVFASESVEDLRRVLEIQLKSGVKSLEQKQRIYRWAENISGTTAANYLLNVIRCIENKEPRPNAPWLDGS